MRENALAKTYSAPGLLRYALPTMIMMVFMSLYTMVDGIFVSRLIGTAALSAVNIVYPFTNTVAAVGIMLSTGASALIAVQMGEGNEKEAKENFSFIIAVAIIVGLLISILAFLFLTPILNFLGANEAVWQYCYDYAAALIWFAPLSMLQLMFQYFFVTAGRPNLGLLVTGLGGLANIVLDYVFIAKLDWGIAGAGIATGIGYSIPAVFGLCFFFLSRKGSLHFVKPKFRGKVLFKSCTNGSSEMVTNLSIAVITLLFNLTMMRLVGEDGVAAITIVLYSEFLLVSIYLGYSSGVAPIISYKYGSQNVEELRHIFKVSLRFIIGTSVAVFLAAIFLNEYIVGVFVAPDDPVWALATRGFFLYAFAYLLKGINIFSSALFTALNNGLVSAILSFLRTFLFIVVALMLLPRFLGVDGVWLSVPIAETLAVTVSIIFLVRKRKVYQYV